MPPATQNQLLDLTRQLINSIADQDWSVYERLCDPSLTCFEPESRGQLVTGMDFHKFYFELKGSRGPRNTTRWHRRFACSAPMRPSSAATCG